MQLRSLEEFRKEVLRRLKENESNWKAQAKTFEEYIKNNNAENFINYEYKWYKSPLHLKTVTLTPERYFNYSVSTAISNIEMS
jgi:hypothetical protein